MIELVKAVTVIESVYAFRVNYIIKRNIYMGEDYLTTNEETNPGQPPKCSWLIDDYGKFRNFTIDRLLFN